MADSPSERRAAAFIRADTLISYRVPSGGSDAPGPSGNDGNEEHHPQRVPAIKPYVQKMGTCEYLKKSTQEVVCGSKLNVLLIFLPAALALSWYQAHGKEELKSKLDPAIFVVSLFALIPLAERLGFITEEIARHTNDTIGGLLNATFGNATEVIICGFALMNAHKDKSFLRVVQLSLLGSVLSNLLLVLGSAFLVGGIIHPSQNFNQEGMTINSGLLVMSVTAILLPSTLKATGTWREPPKDPSLYYSASSELNLSRFESVFLLAAYSMYLVFQLWTHRHLFENDEDETEVDGSEDESDDGSKVNEEEILDRRPSSFQNKLQAGFGIILKPQIVSGDSMDDPDVDWNEGYMVPLIPPDSERMIPIKEDEEAQANLSNTTAIQSQPAGEETVHGAVISKAPEGPVLGLWGSLVWLTIVTIGIAVLSEFVVDTIQGAAVGLDVPIPFLSTIVLPIVGNAAEHASAILFAYKNRMEITLGVAVGSSTQIAVFVIPFCVVLGWIMGEELDLNFQPFESIALFLSVLLAVVAMHDGTSNWLKGVMLSMTYLFIAAAFWMHNDEELKSTAASSSRRLLLKPVDWA